MNKCGRKRESRQSHLFVALQACGMLADKAGVPKEEKWTAMLAA